MYLLKDAKGREAEWNVGPFVRSSASCNGTSSNTREGCRTALGRDQLGSTYPLGSSRASAVLQPGGRRYVQSSSPSQEGSAATKNNLVASLVVNFVASFVVSFVDLRFSTTIMTTNFDLEPARIPERNVGAGLSRDGKRWHVSRRNRLRGATPCREASPTTWRSSARLIVIVLVIVLLLERGMPTFAKAMEDVPARIR